jgi:hypothetical protein
VSKAVALVSLNKTDLSKASGLPSLTPLLPLRSVRSLSISVALATVALGPASGARAWMGTVGRVAFPDVIFPLLRTIVL